MNNYKVYKNHRGEDCYKLLVEWRDESQPSYRGPHMNEENLVLVEECLVYDLETSENVLDFDYLGVWAEGCAINRMNGDWDDISDICWEIEEE